MLHVNDDAAARLWRMRLMGRFTTVVVAADVVTLKAGLYYNSASGRVVGFAFTGPLFHKAHDAAPKPDCAAGAGGPPKRSRVEGAAPSSAIGGKLEDRAAIKMLLFMII